MLRPILSLVVVGMELAGVYEEMCAWLPISVLLNISVTLAVYALMLFYHAFADKLNKGRQRPLAKFICIKVWLDGLEGYCCTLLPHMYA